MALKYLKEIIDTRGYKIQSRDRQIFERGDLQTFFGFSDNDAIEVLIFDINDNQLPQSNFGMARYIPMTTENIRDYFLIADGTILQMYRFPNEYFIDVERIVKEAGYDNGIFKTQITLVNHRVGSNKKFDKLWISEISPSRTEVRLLPLKRKETEGTDLFERYGVFMRDGEFREDTITYAINLIEEINPALIATFIKNKYSEDWYFKLKSEFNIQNFDAFCTNVHKKFVESALFEFSNRISNPKDLNYGKPKPYKAPLELSKSTIKDLCFGLVIRAIDYYLSSPVIRYASDERLTTDESMDIVGQVSQRTESDISIDVIPPEIKIIDRKKVIVKEADIILEDLKKKEKPQLPIDIIDTPGFKDEPIEFIKPDLPVDLPPNPPVKTEEQEVPVKSGGEISAGGGGGGYDWTSQYDNYNVVDSGLGKERVGARPAENRGNLK